VFDQYLPAFVNSLLAGVTQAWLNGSLSLQVEQDARGYVHAMQHLHDMTLANLRAFWALPPERPVDWSEPRRDSATGYS
jgi:hypothetical protein